MFIYISIRQPVIRLINMCLAHMEAIVYMYTPWHHLFIVQTDHGVISLVPRLPPTYLSFGVEPGDEATCTCRCKGLVGLSKQEGGRL